jgi:hypothetical protein
MCARLRPDIGAVTTTLTYDLSYHKKVFLEYFNLGSNIGEAQTQAASVRLASICGTISRRAVWSRCAVDTAAPMSPPRTAHVLKILLRSVATLPQWWRTVAERLRMMALTRPTPPKTFVSAEVRRSHFCKICPSQRQGVWATQLNAFLIERFRPVFLFLDTVDDNYDNDQEHDGANGGSNDQCRAGRRRGAIVFYG